MKYLESKENKSHENINIFSANNEHSSNNVIENISTECVNNISKNIFSSNINNEKIDLQLEKEEMEKWIFVIKIFLNINKISKILLNMYVNVVKGYIFNIKFLLYQNHVLKTSLMN